MNSSSLYPAILVFACPTDYSIVGAHRRAPFTNVRSENWLGEVTADLVVDEVQP